MASPAATKRDTQPVPTGTYRIGWISLLASLVGILAGLIAFVLYDLIALFTNLTFYHVVSLHFRSPEHTTIGPWIILMPVIGGIIIGFMAKYGTSKIKGHGIPEAMEAVLLRAAASRPESRSLSRFPPRSPSAQAAHSAPKGRLFRQAARFGSLVGQLISTTASERKVLLACGAGAGMAATFNTPIAGVILAIELLLFEFRARSFIPLVIACTLATSVRGVAVRPASMFAWATWISTCRAVCRFICCWA